MRRNMPCPSDCGPMSPPDDPFDEWLDWLDEDLREDGIELDEGRLVSLGRERYEAGMSAGTAALQIAELLDEEDEQ